MNNATIDELTQIAIRFRDERDWKQFHNPKDLAIQLSVEAAELLEHMLWKNDDALSRHLSANKESTADELADVLHVAFLLADTLQIDLGEAFVNKMRKNAFKYPVEKARGVAKKYTEL